MAGPKLAIQDVHAAVSSGLRYVDLNRRVNHDYDPV